jgi:hypothetical protein
MDAILVLLVIAAIIVIVPLMGEGGLRLLQQMFK